MIDEQMDEELQRKAAQLVELAKKPDPSISSIELITGKQAEEVSDDENEEETR